VTTRTEFPRPIREIEHTRLTLSDGCRLAARIWIPEDAEADPVPAILEFLPYRKVDGTAIPTASSRTSTRSRSTPTASR
jgi:predicted acyl esterase